jgi:hypothetical protein
MNDRESFGGPRPDLRQEVSHARGLEPQTFNAANPWMLPRSGHANLLPDEHQTKACNASIAVVIR